MSTDGSRFSRSASSCSCHPLCIGFPLPFSVSMTDKPYFRHKASEAFPYILIVAPAVAVVLFPIFHAHGLTRCGLIMPVFRWVVMTASYFPLKEPFLHFHADLVSKPGVTSPLTKLHQMRYPVHHPSCGIVRSYHILIGSLTDAADGILKNGTPPSVPIHGVIDGFSREPALCPFLGGLILVSMYVMELSDG